MYPHKSINILITFFDQRHIITTNVTNKYDQPGDKQLLQLQLSVLACETAQAQEFWLKHLSQKRDLKRLWFGYSADVEQEISWCAPPQ